MKNRSFVPHWLLWCLPAIVSVQVLLMLVSSGPHATWRGSGYTAAMAAMAACTVVAGCAGLWALWRLRDWPVVLRLFIALVQAPLLAGALLMAGA